MLAGQIYCSVGFFNYMDPLMASHFRSSRPFADPAPTVSLDDVNDGTKIFFLNLLHLFLNDRILFVAAAMAFGGATEQWCWFVSRVSQLWPSEHNTLHRIDHGLLLGYISNCRLWSMVVYTTISAYSRSRSALFSALFYSLSALFPFLFSN